MDKIKSTVVDRAGYTAIAEQASITSKDIIPRRRTNTQMVQNILLVWLDKNIDENSTDYQNTVSQLQRVANTIHTFTDTDRCVDFLTDKFNEKVVMIISGELCHNTMPLIHDIDQLDVIYILGRDKTKYEQWAKIKGVFTEIAPICKAFEQVTYKREQNVVSIGFMTTSNMFSKKLDQLDCSYMYTQVLKEILLTIEFDKEYIEAFAHYCRDVFVENKAIIAKINEFERTYCHKTPTWWYTCEYFLYSMLNRALRLMDTDIIIEMAFFIVDLHHHIEQLHSAQLEGSHFGSTFTVYRGQGLSETDFEQMKKTKGGLMAFNNFLSTSKNRDVSLAFAESNQSNPDLVGILFVIHIDTSISTTPFASISDVSYFQEEDEVLFSMHAVFRIRDIEPIDESNRLFQVHLILTSDNDDDLRAVTDYVREETTGREGWDRLGELLLRMGQFDKAEQLYAVVVEHATEDSEKVLVYYQLGRVKIDQGAYKEAIIFYEKVLEIELKSFPPNYRRLAASYNNIGAAYVSMNEYSQALSYFEKALEINQEILPSNHPDLAKAYIAHGIVYEDMGEHLKAITFYEKGLTIQQQSLPLNHPDFSMSYNNIGIVYGSMGDYPKALSYYEKALEIRQKTLPPNHSDLGASYNNIGMVYLKMNKHSEALSYFEKDLEICQKTLPSDHPDLGISYNNIGAVYRNMDKYSESLAYYEKALKISQKTLPPNHPDLDALYNSIGTVYYFMDKYSEALSYYERALEIRQNTLPSNHPDLDTLYNSIGMMYCNMHKYSEALPYYERALEIRQKTLPPNHPDLGFLYKIIGTVYYIMDKYSEALSYYERALEIRQKTLPPNHPDLGTLYNSIGTMYEYMGDYTKARSFYERAVDNGQHSLPPNDPTLVQQRQNLEDV